MIDIRNYLSPERVIDLKSTSKDGAIMELVALSADSTAVEDAEKLQEAIFEREGIMSTGIAFTLQVVAQRHAHPTHASIVMSTEAVFAVLGGYLFLAETLPLRNLAGCALMLAGMIISQLTAPKQINII